MKLTVLSVAYPLAPVAPSTAGGAEQVVGQIDRALTARGHSSIVIACRGSQVKGKLVETSSLPCVLNEAAFATAQKIHAAAIARALHTHRIDLVHMHGVDFNAYLPAPGVPVLATLHLPLSRYPPDALRPKRPDTFLHCVSQAQQRLAPRGLDLLPPIENGVDADAFGLPQRKRNLALFLGRICPEKGVHLAIEAARLAGIPLLIAGEAFGYESHLRYFAEFIAPKLNRDCRFLGAVGGRQKRRLLAMARCVLLPACTEETSSLVAREALAAGAPPIAFPRGALTATIDHDRTGFLVNGIEEMARAIRRADRIDPAVCCGEAKRRFRLEKTIAAYLERYRLLSRLRSEAAA